MKNVIKLKLDLSQIVEDPELKEELYRQEKPLKVAAVRKGEMLSAVEIEIERIKDVSKIPITLEFDYPEEYPPGAYIMIGPNIAEKEFLGIETKKIWISPRKFEDHVADLTKEIIVIPPYLFRRWILLCRTFRITGRVVKRVFIDGVPCDEPVPGAKVEAYDVDCWWFWWKKDLVGSAVTNPDGTFEIKFGWCCLIPLPWLKPKWVIDPDLLKHLTKALKPHIGPIPPEILKSPDEFERFLSGIYQTPQIPLPPPKSIEFAEQKTLEPFSPIQDLISKLQPLLPQLPCWQWPWRFRDCTPDIVFKVTQECEGVENVIYSEGPLQTRWNIPTSLNVTLFANDKACSIAECEEPPTGDCLKFSHVNCVEEQNIGDSAGPSALRGYAYPGGTDPTWADNPFAGTIWMRGLFGANSDVDYFRVEYGFNDGAFKDMPKDHLIPFVRRYWAPPPASPPSTPAKWNDVLFKPDEVDGKIVYKTLKKAEEEITLPAGWTWGYLWNDYTTLFYWNSRDLEGDGPYTIRLWGYRWNDTTKKLENEHVMLTCEIQAAQEETIMVRIDNRVADDPVYESNEDRPCGAGTIHLCTYEPDCDFVKIALAEKNVSGEIVEVKEIGPCDIVELPNDKYIVIHFNASVPKNRNDGHLLAYSLYAHWGENEVFNVLTQSEKTIEYPDGAMPDPDMLVGPTYQKTFAGIQALHRSTLPATHPEHDRPYWFGGNFKVIVKGDKFETCAYTLNLRVWKRTIEGCVDPYHVHVNWCSYSFTIQKI